MMGYLWLSRNKKTEKATENFKTTSSLSFFTSDLSSLMSIWFRFGTTKLWFCCCFLVDPIWIMVKQNRLGFGVYVMI